MHGFIIILGSMPGCSRPQRGDSWGMRASLDLATCSRRLLTFSMKEFTKSLTFFFLCSGSCPSTRASAFSFVLSFAIRVCTI